MRLVIEPEGRRIQRDREVWDGKGRSIGQGQSQRPDQDEGLHAYVDRQREDDDGRSLEGCRGRKGSHKDDNQFNDYDYHFNDHHDDNTASR
jgi:hypothetical protein